MASTIPYVNSSGGRIDVPITSSGPNTSVLPKFPSKSSLVKRQASLYKPALYVDVEVRIQGLNVVEEHWDTFQAILPGWLIIAQERAGRIMVEEARAGLRGERGLARAYLSGLTHDSVHHYISTSGDAVKVSVGPSTWYAPLIEYGMASHSGKGPRPFMFNASAATLPGLIQAYGDLALVAKYGAHAVLTPGPYKKDLEAWLRRFRAKLYSIERALGNISVIGPVNLPRIPGTGKFRAALLGSARMIGDLQSVMAKAVGMRFQRRLTGRVTGRLIGIGSHTLFSSKVFGGRITGAERVYNVYAGKFVTKYVDQNKSLGKFLGNS